jgi:hypothetical protein
MNAALYELRALIMRALDRGTPPTEAEMDDLAERHENVAEARLRVLLADSKGWS